MWIARRFVEALFERIETLEIEVVEERARADERLRRVTEGATIEVRELRTTLLEQLAAVKGAHAAAVIRAQTAEDRAKVDRANFDWIAAFMVEIQHREAQLQARVLAIEPRVVTVGRQPVDTPSVTVRTDGEVAGTPLEDTAVPDLLRSERGPFDDVGDEMAEQLGLAHGLGGELVYGATAPRRTHG